MIFSVRVSTAETESSRIRIGAFFKQGTRNRDALLLSAGDGHAALTEYGLVAVLEVHDVVPHIGQRGGAVNVGLAGVVHAEADVVGNRVREQEVVLRHVGTALTHGVDGNGVDIVVINEQRSVRHVVGAEQQIDDGRFPEPVFPTMPTLSPGSMVNDTFFSTSYSPSG